METSDDWFINSSLMAKYAHMKIWTKRYFIIDQQIVFVHCSACLYHPLFPFMQLKYLTLFLLQGSQPITIKGWDFSQSYNPFADNVPLVQNIFQVNIKLHWKKRKCRMHCSYHKCKYSQDTYPYIQRQIDRKQGRYRCINKQIDRKQGRYRSINKYVDRQKIQLTVIA